MLLGNFSCKTALFDARKECDVYSIDHTVSKKRLQSLDQGMTELYCCNGASSKLKGEELWQVEP